MAKEPLDSRLAIWIGTRKWSNEAAPVWFLFVSPMLWWALGEQGSLFTWPKGATKNPLHPSFWHVGYRPHDWDAQFTEMAATAEEEGL